MNILPHLPSLAQFSPLSHWPHRLWRKPAPRACRAASPAPASTSPPLPVAEVEIVQPGWGCGWFDSSHELQQGLLVRESGASEALAAELPLDLWLDWYRGAQSAGEHGAI